MSTKPFHYESSHADTFDAPETFADAQDRLTILREELGKIRSQLSDPARREKMNWTEVEYQTWRHKALHARNVKMTQQSRLQRWIQDQRAQRAVIALRTNDPLVLLGRMLDLVDDITRVDHVPFSSSDQDLLALTRKIVNENPVLVP
jgi:hypothetical protein